TTSSGCTPLDVVARGARLDAAWLTSMPGNSMVTGCWARACDESAAHDAEASATAGRILTKVLEHMTRRPRCDVSGTSQRTKSSQPGSRQSRSAYCQYTPTDMLACDHD